MVKKCLDFVKKHPLESVIAFLVIVLAYGFYATKYTFGIDLLQRDLYDGYGLVTAGRWAGPLIQLFTNWMEYSPFWHTSVMMCLLWISGLCWITLFNMVSDNKMKSISLFSFWIVFPVFPIITAQISFPMLNIALAYVLIPIVLWQLYPILFCKQFELKNFIVSLILMVISIDMYESFAAVYLVGMFGILIIRYLYSDESNVKQSKQILQTISILFKNAAFIISAVLIDFTISKLACYCVSGSFKFWYTTNTAFYWFKYGSLIDAMTYFLREFIAKYWIYAAGSVSIFIFDCMIIASVIYAIVKSIRKHSFMPLILFAGLCLSSISLFIVLGNLPTDRMEQAMPVFVAFVLMVIWETVNERRAVCWVLTACTTLLVLSETQASNNYAVRYYEIFEYQNDWMRNIGTELEKYDTADKPVAFIADDVALLPQTLMADKTSTNLSRAFFRKYACKFWDSVLPDSFFSCMDWILWNSNNTEVVDTSSLISALSIHMSRINSTMSLLMYNEYYSVADGYYAMKRMGYNYQYPSTEQYELAETYLQPNDTSCKFKITETDEIIVVQLMSCEK